MNRHDMEKTLRFTAEHFPRSQEAQYLKLGKWFSREAFTKAESEQLGLILAGISSFRVGECYMNAGRIAIDRDGIQFCEGFAAGLWPVPHAWVEYKDRAIDVTWPVAWEPKLCDQAVSTPAEIMERVNFNIKNCTYFGVAIPTKIFRKHILSVESWSPLFDARFARDWTEFEKALA